MAVYLIFKHGKRFRCAPSFNKIKIKNASSKKVSTNQLPTTAAPDCAIQSELHESHILSFHGCVFAAAKIGLDLFFDAIFLISSSYKNNSNKCTFRSFLSSLWSDYDSGMKRNDRSGIPVGSPLLDSLANYVGEYKYFPRKFSSNMK